MIVFLSFFYFFIFFAWIRIRIVIPGSVTNFFTSWIRIRHTAGTYYHYPEYTFILS